MHFSDLSSHRQSLGIFAAKISNEFELECLKKAIAAAIDTEPFSRAPHFQRYEIVAGLPYSSRIFLNFMSTKGVPLEREYMTIQGLAETLLDFFSGPEARFATGCEERTDKRFVKGFEVFRVRAFDRHVLMVNAAWIER